MRSQQGQTRGERRETRRLKKRYGMRVQGRSVFLIQEILRRKAKRAEERATRKALNGVWAER